jgi:hypothetical protein
MNHDEPPPQRANRAAPQDVAGADPVHSDDPARPVQTKLSTRLTPAHFDR